MQSRAALMALLLALGSLPACHNRFPVNGDEAGVDAGVDGPLLVPDGATVSCADRVTPLDLHSDPRGLVTLALPANARVKWLSAARDGSSAAAIDRDEIAAFVAAQRPAEDLQVFSDTFQARLAHQLGGTATVVVRASGARGISPDGEQALKEAAWELSFGKPSTVAAGRAHVLAALLNRHLDELDVGPLSGAELDKLLVKLTLARRSDGTGLVVISGAVVGAKSYDDPASGLSSRVDDLSNGSAVSSPRATPTATCENAPLTQRPTADILWVVDESGSMNDNRNDIVNNAKRFFAKALAAGLDFRMGVAGMKNPTAGGILGKFCSRSSTDTSDDGGEDRFLAPSEQDTFAACVRNPPFLESGTEFGLAHTYHALERHLPRAADDPAKIRPDAKLAVIIVTDESPQELKSGSTFNGVPGFLSYSEYPSCSLTATRQTQLESYLAPWLALLRAPESSATVHVIGGVCGNACKAEIAHGYRQLAERTGGHIGDVCQQDLSATLQVIIDSIVASASPYVLTQLPISSTLQVALNGLSIPRHRNKGYVYNAATNSLTFVNVAVSKGQLVTTSYQRWAAP